MFRRGEPRGYENSRRRKCAGTSAIREPLNPAPNPPTRRGRARTWWGKAHVGGGTTSANAKNIANRPHGLQQQARHV